MYRGVIEKVRPEKDNEERCSICGRKQLKSDNSSGWHRIAVYHCDDDLEISKTFRYYNVCSFDCYLKQVRKSLDELDTSKTARIDGMDLAFVRKLLFYYGS